MMNGATSFMNKTLNDVLFVHEIEEGALEIAKKAFHIEAAVSDAMRASRGLLVKNVRLVLDDSDCASFNAGDCPLLMGDRLRLQNVIMSFIENAVKLSSPLSVVTVKITKKYSDIYFPSSRVHRVMSVISNSTSNSNMDRRVNAEIALGMRRAAAKTLSVERSEEGKKDTDNKTEEGSPSPVGCMGPNHTRFGPPIGPRGEQIASPKLHYRSPTSVATRVCEVLVTVTNTGAGVSKDDLEGLLRPYSQIRPDHFEQGRGTGLWLVLAKEITNLHGGEVIIDSVEGKGSTFGFSIPFDIATRAQERNADLLQIANAASDRLLESHFERSADSPINLPLDKPLESPLEADLEPEETTRPAETTRKYLVVDGEMREMSVHHAICASHSSYVTSTYCSFAYVPLSLHVMCLASFVCVSLTLPRVTEDL
jgi:signal transduction histidine kinase